MGKGHHTSQGAYTRISRNGWWVDLGNRVEIVWGQTWNREPCDHHVLYARHGPSDTRHGGREGFTYPEAGRFRGDVPVSLITTADLGGRRQRAWGGAGWSRMEQGGTGKVVIPM